MYIAISEENKDLLREFKKDVSDVKQEAKELSFSLFIQLKRLMFQFLISYKEYSLTNIREYGLGEILMSRAMRFFKLDDDSREKKTALKKEKQIHKSSRSKQISKKGGVYIVRRAVKYILYPFYLIIICLQLLFKSEPKEKSNSYVKDKRE
ncbi:MAG TPA: hypothetical protein VKX29_00120 [Brumimicrobium sp.]|nr:hypothetical protein [Brumimicrobium sp.]